MFGTLYCPLWLSGTHVFHTKVKLRECWLQNFNGCGSFKWKLPVSGLGFFLVCFFFACFFSLWVFFCLGWVVFFLFFFNWKQLHFPSNLCSFINFWTIAEEQKQRQRFYLQYSKKRIFAFAKFLSLFFQCELLPYTSVSAARLWSFLTGDICLKLGILNAKQKKKFQHSVLLWGFFVFLGFLVVFVLFFCLVGKRTAAKIRNKSWRSAYQIML